MFSVDVLGCESGLTCDGSTFALQSITSSLSVCLSYSLDTLFSSCLILKIFVLHVKFTQKYHKRQKWFNSKEYNGEVNKK